MSPGPFLFAVIAAVTLGMAIGAVITRRDHNKLKVEAVELGYAEWIPDNAGETTFTWKPKP